LSSPRGKSACLVEVQVTSRPSVFARKAAAYLAWFASGECAAQTGFRSLRVLTVTDTLTRARHHQVAAERLGGGTQFWATAIDQVRASPWGAIWLVASKPERYPLVSAYSNPTVSRNDG